MRVIICSHEADVDGIYSASVALMKYPDADVLFYNYGIDNFTKMYDYLKFESKKTRNGLAIISDLGVNNEVIDLCKDSIEYLVNNRWSVTWVDHHPWPRKALTSIRKRANLFHDSSGNKCATELMYEKFKYKNKIAEQLSLIAHSSDFMSNIKNYDSRVSELIHFYRNNADVKEKLKSLVLKSSRGILWDADMQRDYTKFIKISEFQKRASLKTLVIKKILSFNVAFVFTYPYVQTSLFAQELFSNFKIDLALLFNRNGKVSIRRNTDKISCSKIASHLIEGGGHEFASGGRLKNDARNFKACIAEMQKAVIKALE
jgi:uncharacterized protein